MTFEIYPSSDIAKTGERSNKKYQFPFATLTEGQSLQIPVGTISIQVLRTTAQRAGKKLGVKFRVVNHGSVFEVAHMGKRDADQV